MNPDACPICNVPWPEHDGPTRLCKDLQEALRGEREAIAALEKMREALEAAMREASHGCYPAVAADVGLKDCTCWVSLAQRALGRTA